MGNAMEDDDLAGEDEDEDQLDELDELDDDFEDAYLDDLLDEDDEV